MSARAIDDARAATRATAAALAAIATSLAEASAEPTPDARALRAVALTVQALGHRAAVVASGATFTAGQLVAFAVVQAEALDRARDAVEAGAREDAGNYLREGETQEPSAYAAEAFVAWAHDEGLESFAPLDLVGAERVYVEAFTRAVAD